MANRIPKDLAVADDSSLARLSLYPRTAPIVADDELLNIEPLLDRLERLETQVESIVRQPPAEARDEIPDIVQQHAAARIDDLRDRFAAELEQLSSRVGSLEQAMVEQAGSIEALGARAAETDNNLRRLVVAVEKLCERAQPAALAPEQARVNETPFESQLRDAIEREPVVSAPGAENRGAEVDALARALAAAASKQAQPKKSRFPFFAI
jgi:uncharacterized coiled-coil protein SlyX